MRTHFQDFVRDNGQPVTVEWRVASEGESNFDHPGHICDGGGSGPIIEIVDVWPNTPRHERLTRLEMNILLACGRNTWTRLLGIILAAPVHFAAAVDTWRHATLTEAECEAAEMWLCEHYEPEPYDPADDY
jgi:hypothetical protein